MLGLQSAQLYDIHAVTQPRIDFSTLLDFGLVYLMPKNKEGVLPYYMKSTSALEAQELPLIRR